jgi:REP element-mobilizing transposase RayT
VDRDALFFLTVCCAQRGTIQLTQPPVFGVISDAIEYYVDSGKWWVESFLVMPDHWHALIAFPDMAQMEKIIKNWKRYTAKQGGIIWQDGFFEHRLRSRQSADEKWRYIQLNPVRKGLVGAPEDWPYVWKTNETAR